MRKMLVAILGASLFLVPALALSSSGIKKIVHADGRIEFTNVKNSGSNVISSQKRPSTGKIFKFRHDDGVVTYSDKSPGKGVAHEVYKVACFACSSHSTVNWHTTKLFKSKYSDQIRQTATQYKVDPALIKAVIHAESAFNDKAKSSQGAMGLMQLMPATAKELGVDNAFNSTMNINGGTKYLAQLLRMFGGNIELASAAYNAGPNAVKKYGGIPPYRETQNYVKRVGILHSRYQKL
ncbi:lytic transglycosylase domain-containing protein [Alkalimarinus sediminis]|uniref:lytic transglycosylase domain-containing protein n=1 Tax=Alkalimarinus sediminis TaxID=1632866 RepID=UPI0023B020CC|nr:lytic transglycosylase domain-containing protein [Alkalimarinus sediminis]